MPTILNPCSRVPYARRRLCEVACTGECRPERDHEVYLYQWIDCLIFEPVIERCDDEHIEIRHAGHGFGDSSHGAVGDGVPSEKDGQEIYVNGRVDGRSSGKPVQGVRVAAGSWSALTDEEGRYRVRVLSYMVQLTPFF